MALETISDNSTDRRHKKNWDLADEPSRPQ
jgi:hypothetical protein